MAKISGQAERSPLTEVGLRMEAERRTDIRQQQQQNLQREMAARQEKMQITQMRFKQHILQTQMRQEREFRYFDAARQDKVKAAAVTFDRKKWQAETGIDLAKLGLAAKAEQRAGVESQAEMYARYGLKTKTEDGKYTVEPIPTKEDGIPGGTEGMEARTALMRAQTAFAKARGIGLADQAKIIAEIKKKRAIIGAVQGEWPEWGHANIQYIADLVDSGMTPDDVLSAAAESVNRERIAKAADVVYDEDAPEDLRVRAAFDLGNLNKALGIAAQDYLSDKQGKARQKAAERQWSSAAKDYRSELRIYRQARDKLTEGLAGGLLTPEYIDRYNAISKEMSRREDELTKLASRAARDATDYKEDPKVMGYITMRMPDAQIQADLAMLRTVSDSQFENYRKGWEEQNGYGPSRAEFTKLFESVLSFRELFRTPGPYSTVGKLSSLLTIPAPGQMIGAAGQIEKTGATFRIEEAQRRLTGLGTKAEGAQDAGPAF
ncbi:hypothetical protein LCGC14_1420520 [marine sediment metagenome]|uniref:Uncharacterized protein n=1 Tax=marine sediment metagenome TaxID=412755 RepID=A0A0F9MT70_9ZZZZ